MKITRTSLISGVTRTLDINITEDQMRFWESGKNIQDVAPHLTPGEREFLISGITDEEWDAAFPEEEEE